MLLQSFFYKLSKIDLNPLPVSEPDFVPEVPRNSGPFVKYASKLCLHGALAIGIVNKSGICIGTKTVISWEHSGHSIMNLLFEVNKINIKSFLISKNESVKYLLRSYIQKYVIYT